MPESLIRAVELDAIGNQRLPAPMHPRSELAIMGDHQASYSLGLIEFHAGRTAEAADYFRKSLSVSNARLIPILSLLRQRVSLKRAALMLADDARVQWEVLKTGVFFRFG